MIRTRSPYYLDINFTSPASGLVSTDITLNIYVWLGSLVSEPTEPTYQINKKKYSENSVSIDISAFVRDSIDVYSSTSEFVWVKTTVVYNTGNVLDIDVEQLSQINLASEGFTRTLEGRNYTDENNGVLIKNKERYLFRGTNYQLPYLKQNTTPLHTSFTLQSKPNNEIDTTINEQVTNDSRIKIQYLNIGSSVVDDSYIQLDYGSESVYFDLITPLDNEVKELTFINSFGAKDTIQFIKQRNNKVTTKAEKYTASRGQSVDGYHRFVDFNKNGREGFTLDTPYILEDNNKDIEELLLSEFVWIDGNVPVNIKTSSVTYKTKLNDNLISYSLDVEYSFNNINNN